MAYSEPMQERANYHTIKKGDDGRTAFRLKTHSDDPRAVRRSYTNPKTKEDGVAYEIADQALIGIIENVEFVENSLADKTILRSININLGKNEDGVSVIISLPQDSRFAADFMRKLPNVDLTKEVRFAPHDYEKDGKRKVGIFMDHRNPETDKFDQNILDAFTTFEQKDGKWVVTNHKGIPEPTEEDKDDWEFYFKKVEKFLINYTKENILPKFQQNPVQATSTDAVEALGNAVAPKDTINPDDIPF